MNYIGRRLGNAIFLLVAVSVFSFALLQWTPGDFFDVMRLDPRTSAQTINGLRSQFGLKQSYVARYTHWVISVFEGNMGYSFAYDAPVAPLLWNRARNTLLLTSIATLMAWLLAIPVGIWSAARRDGWADHMFGLGVSALLSVPDLILFLMLLAMAVRTGWFPVGGMLSGHFASLSFWGRVQDLAIHFALPVTALALTMMPVLVRHIRTAVIEMLESPFMLAARAHGIPQPRLLFRYALPAASNPLISLLGFSIGAMLSGSAILEIIMSWPGLGPLMVHAILSRDVYVVTAIVMASSLFLIAGNLFADVLLFISDPRIRVGASQ